MSEDAPPPGGDEPQPLSLRDAEVAPPRKTLAEILDGLPTEPGVYIMKDARGKVIYIGKAAVLRNRVRQYFQPAHRRQPRLRAAAGGHRRRHRNRRHLEREGSAAAREHADQAPPAALQRQPEGRQELPGAAAGPEGGVAAPRGGAAARRRRRALLRPLPLGDVVPRGAAGGEPPLSAAHLHRSRAAQPAAPLPAVPDQALPGALRAAGGARAVRRSGARRAPVPRRQERRAARPAVRAHEGRRRAHRVRAGGRHPRSDPRAGGHAGGAAGGVGRLRRPGRRRLPPRRHRAGDRRDVDPRRQAVGQPRVLVHRPGVSRRRADLVVRRPLLRHGRVGARRGAAAHRHRGRGAEGGVADRAARVAGGRRAQEGRSRCWCPSAAIAAS